MTKLREQVHEFMVATGQEILDNPSVPPSPATVRLRVLLIVEEAFEYAIASTSDRGAHRYLSAAMSNVLKTIQELDADVWDHPNRVEIADALADLDYVVEGARLTYGIDGDRIADIVHATNMKKLEGPIDPVTMKRLKPPGWVPPTVDIAKELNKQCLPK
jgi:predicted HAD superfamily Cof-like phosphohydrolase